MARMPAVISLAVLLALPPSSAGGAGPDPIVGVREDALSHLTRVQALMQDASLGDALRAAFQLSDADPRSVDAPATARGATPIEALSSAVTVASAEARAAISDRHAARRLLDRMVGALAGAASPSGPRDPALLGRLQARGERLVDLARMEGAALMLAETIDATLPSLRRLAPATPPTDPPGDGCDLLDQAPAICVGGTGDNVYEQDYALLVDLGGDDEHRNSAGGAFGLGDGGLAASVTIDLAGNDRYDVDGPTAGGAYAVQGTGYGGIGLLLDAGGADTYQAASTYPSDDGGAQAYAQGGGYFGVGVLSDLGGNDVYRVADPDHTDASARGHGGSIGGHGILVDGAGNDSYLLAADPPPTETEDGIDPGFVSVQGGAFAGLGGSAILSDAGGNDTIRLEAVLGPVDPTAGPGTLGGGGGDANGAGLAVAADAALLLGPGDQTVEVVHHEITTTPDFEPGDLAGPNSAGLGVGVLAGFGGVADAGGDDTYLVGALSRAERSAEIDESCRCDLAQALAAAETAEASGMGWGNFGGVGAMQDAGGDDTYTLAAESIAVATARDLRAEYVPPSEPGPSGARAFARAASAEVAGQGAALFGAAAILEDVGGDDRYEARADAIARSDATATDPDAPTLSGGSAQPSIVLAQAASADQAAASLSDHLGADDYRAVAASVLEVDGTEEPTEDGDMSAQGSVRTSAALFVDGGGTDTFHTSPEDPACEGERGGESWHDCGDGAGYGANR